MKKLIFIFIAISAYATQRSVINAFVNDNGISININFQSMDTNGAYDFNYTTLRGDTIRHITTDTTPYVIVTGQGYDSLTCARNSVSRKIYIDTIFRRNYPNDGNDSAVQYGSDSSVMTFALSEIVFQSETVDSIYLPNGLYISGTDTSAVLYGDHVSANSSAFTYANIKKCIRWSRPDREVVTGNFTVRLVGDHMFWKNWRPFPAVIFTAEDNHSNVFRDTVYGLSISAYEFSDSLKIQEYVCTIDVSSFTVGDSVTVNAKACPWTGDSIWTGDGVNSTKPTPLYAPQYYRYMAASAVHVARVNASTGNDGTGAVTTFDIYNPASPPNKYQTLYAAINGIRSAKSSSDISGFKIYMEAGDYTTYGGTITAGTYCSFGGLFSNFESDSVNLTGTSGSTTFPADSYLKFHGMNFTFSSGNLLYAENGVWVDSCFDRGGGGVLFNQNLCTYATRCKFYQDLDMPYSTGNNPLAICRGCRFAQATSTITPYCFIGNANYIITAPLTLRTEYDGMTAPKPLSCFIGFNYLCQSNSLMSILNDSSTTEGPSFVGNVMEITAVADMLSIAVGDNSELVRQVSFKCNTFHGYKTNLAFNNWGLTGVTDPQIVRDMWEFKNNIFEQVNVITDNDYHDQPPGNKRFFNWSVIFGLNTYGNAILSQTSTYAIDFAGVKVAEPKLTFAPGNFGWVGFVDDNSYAGSGGGFGDYHLSATSPLLSFTDCKLLPYDLDGKQRSAITAAGAYAGPNESIKKKCVIQRRY